MGLRIRRTPSKKVQLLTTLFAAFALVAQPLYGLVSMQIANALTQPGDVIINEIAPATGGVGKWVELYNMSDSPLDISDWRFERGTGGFSNNIPDGTVISGKGFYTIESTDSLPLNSGGLQLELWTDATASNVQVDSVDYGTVPAGQSYGRQTDGNASFQVFSTPTKNASNGAQQTLVAEPQLNAENFNTVDGNYKGISVGFNAKNFGTVTNVTVTLKRAVGGDVVKHGNQGVFDLISNKTAAVQLTTPFFIKDGTYKEADDTLYWDPAPTTWTAATQPTEVIIAVTDENGTKTVTNSAFHQDAPSWPTYLSLVPVDLTGPEIVVNNSSPDDGDYLNGTRDSSNGQRNRFIFNVTDPSSVWKVAMYVFDSSGKKVKEYALEQHGAPHEEQWYADVDTTQLPDGKYQIAARAVDNAAIHHATYFNNRRNSYGVTIDNMGPSVAIDSPTRGTITSRDGLTVKGTVDTSDVSGVDRVVVDVKDMTSGTQGTIRTTVSDGNWTVNLDRSLLPDGHRILIVAYAKDGLMNDGKTTSVEVVIDNTAPVVTMQLKSSAAPSANTPIALAGAVNDPTQLATLKLYRDGGQIADVTTDAKDGAWSHTLPAGLAEGNYTFTAVATDAYGNTSTQTIDSTVVLSVGPFASAGRGVSTFVGGLASPSAPSLIVPSLFTTPATSPFGIIQPEETGDDTTGVLGAETAKGPTQSSDLPVVAATESGWKIFGIAWYWLALILVILASGAWWTAANVRRRKATELA